MVNSVEERKKILTQALNQSFVDDYNAYKSIIDNINSDLKELNIDYQWTYDEFCVEFLNESMKKLEEIDIFRSTNFQDFYRNFWDFNLIVVRDIIMNKFNELGYDYKEFEKHNNIINNN